MSNHNRSSSTKAAERVTIVVFGDLARSPRMLNHCISLCELPTIKRVDLVGYAESELISEVANNDKVHLHVMNAVFPSASTAAVAAPASTSTSFLKFVQRFFLLRALYKIIVQTWTLFYLLMFCVASPDVILMQNPPSIPALSIVWFTCLLRRAKMYVDWHNYGFTLLEIGLAGKHASDGRRSLKTRLIVALARIYEGFFGSLAHGNFCVTKAMQQDLRERWNVSATVLYDTPPERFQECSSSSARKKLRDELAKRISIPLPLVAELDSSVSSSKAVLVSSTSWGDDEDFSILVDALKSYDANYEWRQQQQEQNASKRSSSSSSSALPELLVLITGRGARRDYYMQLFRDAQYRLACRLKFCFIRRRTHERVFDCRMRLADDYPKLLSVVDLGVCLHFSSSGLDLPMKVVDMFGCCLPVCAIDFRCLNELVIDGVNGNVFNDAAQLSTQLIQTMQLSNRTLDEMRSNLRKRFRIEIQKKLARHVEQCSSTDV